MRAVMFTKWTTFPTIEEVEKPSPGPGEVLLKVAGAGACHSDVAVFNDMDGSVAPPQLQPPFVLGHENSGWVEEVGPGVTGIKPGAAYLVYGPIGCGHCPACSRGQDTYCYNIADMPYLASGLGRDGGMAEYMTVPARNLVPLEDSDPIAAAPLSDAGLTPYHAIKLALPTLQGGGKTALVIGLGGLGQLAVQILTAITGATVIATDTKPEAMKRASEHGAIVVPSGDDQATSIRELTGGRGVDAVFDFVGIASTVALAMSSVAVRGRVTIVGIAGGTYEWGFYTAPYEAELLSTYWGTLEELHEVVALYRVGKISPDVEIYDMEEALTAYKKLEAGEIAGRAVVAPNGRG